MTVAWRNKLFINGIRIRSRCDILADGTRHRPMTASRKFCFLARVRARPGDDKFGCVASKFQTATRLGIDPGYSVFRIRQQHDSLDGFMTADE